MNFEEKNIFRDSTEFYGFGIFIFQRFVDAVIHILQSFFLLEVKFFVQNVSFTNFLT